MKRSRSLFTIYRLPGALGLLLLAALAAACSDDPLTEPESSQEAEPQEFLIGDGWGVLRVMTWNVYVGADVDPILEADPQDIPVEVAKAFQVLQSTNFPERARAFARKIALSRPHLIGLQEISTVRLQAEGDFFVNPTPNAEDVLYDYLDILLGTLRDWGLDYELAGVVQNADIELPMIVSQDPLQFSDVRLTDFDVVLARKDVEILNVIARNYDERLIVPVPHPADPNFFIDVRRGYVAVDARVGAKTYRFASTHLEPFQPPAPAPPEYFQLVQSAQLVQDLADGAPAEAPILIVGDLNTPAQTSLTPSGPAYDFLVGVAGYVDIWPHNLLPGQGEGLTNPHDADLRNKTVNFTKRIDLILVQNPALGPVYSWVVGDEQRDRTYPSRLWPSDHAGVVARLRIPVGGQLAAGDE